MDKTVTAALSAGYFMVSMTLIMIQWSVIGMILLPQYLEPIF